MRPGDLVRFATWDDIVSKDWVDKDWSHFPKRRIGVLVKYERWQSTAEILYEGEVLKVRGQLVEKAGKRDYNEV